MDAVVTNYNRTKFSLLRSMKPYVPRKERRLRDDSGNITSGLKAEQVVVKGHFAIALGGTACTLADLIDRDRSDSAKGVEAKNSLVKSIGVVTTRVKLKRRYLQSSTRKALGEAGVGAEVRRLWPTEMTSVFLPLHLKASSSLKSPIMW